MFRISVLLSFAIGLTATSIGFTQTSNSDSPPYTQWKRGVSSDPNFFPLAVWLQSPRNAERFKEAGINLYVGLWSGPTEQQLSALKKAGMSVICSQNETGLNSPDADIIVGWMHGDEPDNAQAIRSGGYGPPIAPSVIQEDYKKIHARDPTRPILLNLGQGVAYDNYIGRGVRRNHAEDYAEYLQGSDIVSFDIYPAVHDQPEVAGKLEFVPRGVERLRRWSKDEKIVWNCIEASRISNPKVKPTPEQIRSEVWMSLIRGSRGIIYFVHQFEPSFKEASLLDDAELLSAVTALNRKIIELAPVLNSPSLDDVVTVDSAAPKSSIEFLCKRHEGSLYIFAANMGQEPSRAQLRLPQEKSTATSAKNLETNQAIALEDLTLKLELPGYGVGLYKIDN